MKLSTLIKTKKENESLAEAKFNYECKDCGAKFGCGHDRIAKGEGCKKCGSKNIKETSMNESKVVVSGIKWDVDDADDVADLPTEVTLTIPSNIDLTDEDEIGDFIENALSDEYGFTHNGWESEKLVESKKTYDVVCEDCDDPIDGAYSTKQLAEEAAKKLIKDGVTCDNCGGNNFGVREDVDGFALKESLTESQAEKDELDYLKSLSGI